MLSPVDVARYLIFLASPREEEEADCLSPLGLQKHLYFVQGWHYGAFGQPLFSGPLEAWTHGPVSPEVYWTFRQYGYQAIPPREGADSPHVPDEAKRFIWGVWTRYKHLSAAALRDLTHRGAPWLSARGDLPPDARCQREITPDSLRAFFGHAATTAVSAHDPRIDPAMWEASRRDIEAGRVRPVGEIRRELRRRRPGSDRGGDPIVGVAG